MNATPCLVTLGYRKGAYEAIARLGMDAVLVNPVAAPRRFRHRIAAWIGEDWGQPESLARELKKALGDRKAGGVLALTEGSVGPAAVLRRSLGFAGISPETARIVRDKLAMKRFFRARGIAVTDWKPIDERTHADDLVEALGLPLVIKQRDSSGSRGLVIARDRAGARAAIRPGWMAERWIQGREMSVESLVGGGIILLSNPTEYLEPLWCNIVPLQLQETQAKMARDLNRAVLAALDFPPGIAHLELFLTEKGPVLGEIALRPPGGHIMELMALAYGFDPWEALIRLEMGEPIALPRQHRQFAGMWLLHPGPGTVGEIRGLAGARATPGIAKLVIKVKEGDRLPPRTGSGQEAGYLLATGATREAVIAALERARENVRFDLDPGP